MSKKQEILNNYVLSSLALAEAELYSTKNPNWKQFRHMTAEICTIENYVILKSFDEIVAAYLIDENTIINAVLFVFGHSRVTNYHIAKFIEYITEKYCQEQSDPDVLKYYNTL